MKRMLARRGVVLGAIVLFATALVGAAGLFSLPDEPAPPVAGKAVPALLAKQAPGQDPRCALQDKDDDDEEDEAKEAKEAKESKEGKESQVKKAKPDTDDDELECDDRKAGDHDKKPEAAKVLKSPAVRK